VNSELNIVNSYTRQLKVEVPWEELQEKYSTFLQKFSRRVRLPGFRKGKVPLKLVRQQYGATVDAEFAETMVQETYLKALEEKGLDPINQATIQGIQFADGMPLRFEATFEIEPEVELPPYAKGFKVEQVIYDADEEDVNQAIDDLRKQQAELRTVEGALEEGYYLLADLQEIEESGMPLIGRKLEDRYFQMIPDSPLGGENFPVLIGAHVGDTRRIAIENEQGNRVHYELTVKEITEQILPDMDDNFAKQVDPNAENLEQLRDIINGRIHAAYERESSRKLHNDISDHFVRNTDVEVPESLFENYLDTLVADLERQGYASKDIDRESLREQHRASIVWNLKWYLIRKKLLDAEEITIDEEAVEARIQQLIAEDEDKSSQIRNYYRRPENRRNLRQDLLSDALFEKLKTYIKIKVIHKPSRELRKAS
jgi:trigger factor